jgi:hypothetical protein
MDNVKNQEFLEQELALIRELRRRLDAASTALEAAFLRRQYAQAVATLQTPKTRHRRHDR